MKYYHILFLILLIVVLGCETEKTEVIITGKITGNINSNIEYSSSQKGASYWGFAEKIKIDSAGKFEVSMHIDQPAFFELLIGGKPSGVMIIEPGEKYDVSFDIASEQFNVFGKSSDAQKIYADLNNESDDFDLDKYLSDSTATKIVKRINTAFENEISQFENLHNSGTISESFLEFIKADRACYYSVIKGNIAASFYVTDQVNNTHFYSEEIEKMMDESYLNIQKLSSSFWFYQLTENYIFYEEFSSGSFNYDSVMQNTNFDNFNFYYIELAQKYLTGEMLEYYLARKLFEESTAMKYQKELLASFENFKKEFPQSEFTKYLEPEITPIAEYLKVANQPFAEGINFIPGQNQINSLEECMKFFEGKKVFVDVWATWCLPCRAEFKHKETLDSLLTSKDYEILYISIDKDDYTIQWEEMVRFYNLNGNHIKANGNLFNDLSRINNQNGYITIPWYMIVNEDGELIIKHAKSPSQLTDLEKQLNEIELL